MSPKPDQTDHQTDNQADNQADNRPDETGTGESASSQQPGIAADNAAESLAESASGLPAQGPKPRSRFLLYCAIGLIYFIMAAYVIGLNNYLGDREAGLQSGVAERLDTMTARLDQLEVRQQGAAKAMPQAMSDAVAADRVAELKARLEVLSQPGTAPELDAEQRARLTQAAALLDELSAQMAAQMATQMAAGMAGK